MQSITANMTITQIIMILVVAFIGSSAAFGFIQFLITRHDKKKEDAKEDVLQELREEFRKGLDERENTGKSRYLEHKEAILKLTEGHEMDYKALTEAINKINVIGSGVVGIIHNTILYITEPILERGAVTYEELDTLDSLYQPYSSLGGNGVCRRRVDDINKLPKISKEEALDRDSKIAAKKREEEVKGS